MDAPHEKSAAERRRDIWINQATDNIVAKFKRRAEQNGQTFEEARAELIQEFEDRAMRRKLGLPSPDYWKNDG